MNTLPPVDRIRQAQRVRNTSSLIAWSIGCKDATENATYAENRGEHKKAASYRFGALCFALAAEAETTAPGALVVPVLMGEAIRLAIREPYMADLSA